MLRFQLHIPMPVTRTFSFLLIALLGVHPAIATDPAYPIHIDNLIVHDPHILADAGTRTYHLYGQYSPKRDWQRRLFETPPERAGVICYSSRDLEHWSRPRIVFEVADGFWADKIDAPWAPEVAAFGNKFYLISTFNDWTTVMEERADRPPITKRCVQVLVGNSPFGPFRPFSNQPTTPRGSMTLDGSLYVDSTGAPWLTYAHEWIQITDGSFEAIRLSPDLSGTVGDPITLIRAGDVSWTKREINYREQGDMPGIVTDGQSLYRMKSGVLAMLWSSWSEERQYATSIAYSDTGRLEGPWRHEPEPVMQDDRGHGTVFTDFDGRLLFVVHRYFKQPATRVQIWELQETTDRIRVAGQILGSP